MAVFNEPTQWDHELGNNADVSTLPDDTGATTGKASLQKLFQLINQTPLEAGGVAPEREDFNALFKFLGDSIFYMQNGGLWSYNSAFDYAVGRVVLYTDNNLYKCIQANDSSDPKAPTDSAYWTKIPTLADFTEYGFNTGDIKPVMSNTIQNGWLLGNSAQVSRTTYSNLYQFAGDNDLIRDATEQTAYESDPLTFTGRIFGAGDGSTTFELPDFRGRSLMGALTSATTGRYQPEQLPNITGELSHNDTRFDNVFNSSDNKALSLKTKSTAEYVSRSPSSFVGNYAVEFDASRANSIYIDNGKVYPASIALNFIIKT